MQLLFLGSRDLLTSLRETVFWSPYPIHSRETFIFLVRRIFLKRKKLVRRRLSLKKGKRLGLIFLGVSGVKHLLADLLLLVSIAVSYIYLAQLDIEKACLMLPFPSPLNGRLFIGLDCWC